MANRGLVMHLGALAVFVFLAYAFAQLGLGAPPPGRPTLHQDQERGHIVSADGRLLAHDTPSGRTYPQGELAGAILGFMGADGGLEGVEYARNAALQQGLEVALTLDTRLQVITERVLADAAAAVNADFASTVILETATGRVLAAATYPGYNPNAWRAVAPGRWRNRALLDEFEPGSVMKPLIVAALLNAEKTTPTTSYDTPMRRTIGGVTIGDIVPHPARLTTQQILRYSSNVGMSRLAEALTPAEMSAALRAYGFGRASTLGVPTGAGQLRPPDEWDDLIRATGAFGQGLTVTTIQLAAAFNVLANDGIYRAPTLLSGPLGTAQPVLRPEVARTTRGMLHAVIDEGISRQAGLPGYHMGGKTGTAQVAQQGRYSESVYTSTFAGFLPADRPQFTVAVMVRGAKRNYQGSQLAAPIFRDIASEVISLKALAPQPPHPIEGR